MRQVDLNNGSANCSELGGEPQLKSKGLRQVQPEPTE